MKILIIGCGYLGKRAAQRWIKNNDDVFALTRTQKNAEALSQMGITPIVGNIMDNDCLENIPSGLPFDIILYAVGWDRSQSYSMRDIYIAGLQNILDRLTFHNFLWAKTRFLYVSSTSVYSQHQGEQIDENSSCEPIKENGRICLEAEQLLEKHFEKSPNTLTIFRCAGIYGPERILTRIEMLKKGLQLHTNPEGWLNLIHVEDAAAVIVAASYKTDKAELQSKYLVVDNMPTKREGYYSLLAQLTNSPPPQYQSATGQSAISQSADIGKQCKNDLVKKDLLFQLQYPTYRDGLKECVSSMTNR